MNDLFHRAKESVYFRIYLLLGILFIGTIFIISRTGNEHEVTEDFEAHKPNLAMSLGKQVTGGLGEAREKDDEVSMLVRKIQPELEEKTKMSFASLDVINYKTQVVAGKNYFVKVKAELTDGSEKTLHLRIWRNLKGEAVLTTYQVDKQATDPLEYFE